MSALVIAVLAAYGTHLVTSGLLLGWRGLGPAPRAAAQGRRRPTVRHWLDQAGLAEVQPAEFLAVVGILAVAGGAVGALIFGVGLPALCVAVFAASFPVAGYRNRRRTRRAVAQEAWPHMIEEIRVLTGSLGRSIPQALLDAGRRGPEEMRDGFAAAEREWLTSTDFERTLQVLKDHLADATADAACETLLVAHQVGGSDLDRRLRDLVEDRVQDVQGRKDARAEQAGVRFARRFVLVVPLGMAAVGLSIGDGRGAYATASGQLAVVAAIAMVVACWVWAGALMRLPEHERVFDR